MRTQRTARLEQALGARFLILGERSDVVVTRKGASGPGDTRRARSSSPEPKLGALTDPDVRISRIRLFGAWVRYAIVGWIIRGTGRGCRLASSPKTFQFIPR